jgi:hypothetical protein
MVSEMLMVGVVNDSWSLTTYIQIIAEEYVISEVMVPSSAGCLEVKRRKGNELYVHTTISQSNFSADAAPGDLLLGEETANQV